MRHSQVRSVDVEAKTRVEEYNVLYKVNKNFSALTGYVNAKPSASLSATDGEENIGVSLTGHNKNIWQVGMMGTVPIKDKFTAYGIAAVGNVITIWKPERVTRLEGS